MRADVTRPGCGRVSPSSQRRRRGCVTHLVTLLVIAEHRAGSTPPLRNPPLVLTVLEIRYPEIAGGLTDAAVSAMKEAVRESLPVMAPQVEHQIGMPIDAAMPPQVEQRLSPRFCARDQATALVVRRDALVLETTVYGGWVEHFRPLAKQATEALAGC